MVEKIVIDPEVPTTPNTLAQKLNELIDVISHSPPGGVPQRREPDKLQYVEYMVTMGQRMRSGPLMFIRQADPNELTKAIEDTLGAFQAAVAAYKESLPKVSPEGG